MIIGTEWGVCSGRPESGNRLLEASNRNHNLLRRAQYVRVPFTVTPNGQFDPEDTNSAVAYMPYSDIIDHVMDNSGALMVCVMIHTLGAENGNGYHKDRPPYVNITQVRNYTELLAQWLAEEGVPVRWWQLGNELDYAPNLDGIGTHLDLYNKWADCFDVFKNRVVFFYPQAKFVSPGTSALEAGGQSGQGKPSINKWIADHNLYPGMTLDIHGNNKPIPELREEIRLARNLGYPVGVFEDRSPTGTGHSDALNRSNACDAEGAVAYFPFGARVSNPSGGSCTWGGQNRQEVGVESCYYQINYDNFDLLTQTAIKHNSLLPGVDQPMEIDQEVHMNKQKAAKAAKLIAKSVSNRPALVAQEILAGTRAQPKKGPIRKARNLLNQILDE